MKITSPFLVVFILSLIFLPILIHSQGLPKLNNNTDQLALLSFKSLVTSDPFGALRTWDPNTPFCTWKGVYCNTIKQRVTGLDIENSSLVGNISPHLTNLSFLSYLNFQNNSFHGSLSEEIGKLFRLQVLSIGFNNLGGTIPVSLTLCSKLYYIDLSRNNLEGTIPPGIGSFSYLQTLSFEHNFLTGKIPSSLGNLTSLVYLILSYNSLQGKIPEGLGELPILIYLGLSLNYLSGQFPISIFNISSLNSLFVGGNNLTGTLPNNMFDNLNNLVYFSMGENQLSGLIPASLGNASQLIRVDFSRSSFTGNIPVLGNLPNIEFLSFDTNELESKGKDGWDFLTSLSNSSKLQVLSLSTNHLTGNIPLFIGNLSPNLYMLILAGNQIIGEIPEQVSNLKGLSMLSLEHNSLAGNIPPSIGTMPNLQNLYLHSNRLWGEIPETLGNLTFMIEFSLRYNFLTGTIPLSLGNLQHVQVIDLSHNLLSGMIPREIFISSLAKLLDLSWNNFTGSLDERVGKMRMVQGLDLSGNNLIGEIPNSIGDCSNLLILNLSRNVFRGSIPNSLANLKGVEYIDFSSNNLSGEIPNSLATLQFLKLLNLSENQFEGEVPKGGVFENATDVFLGQNPKICGGTSQLALPACYVQIATKHPKKSNLKLILGLVLGLSGAVLIFLVALVIYLRKKKEKKTTINNDDAGEFGVHKLYTHNDLKISTSNFSQGNLIGEGSYGTVYKAVFGDGMVAAIKVFKLLQYRASKSFLAECEALRSIRHRNLVKTISVCSTGDFKALVLQFMPNGSLEKWLHKRNEEEEMKLDMKKRVEIAQDIANAIEYLHHDCETPIVHCDLKPSNVLLDENMCAHVSDFGLARILVSEEKQMTSSTLGLKGSIGYIPPEYGVAGGLSTKGDVYSFGILLLELFTDKRPTDEIFSEETDIQRWVWLEIQDRVTSMVFLKLLEQEHNSFSSDCIVKVLEIGLKCAAKSPEIRPSMREGNLEFLNLNACGKIPFSYPLSTAPDCGDQAYKLRCNSATCDLFLKAFNMSSYLVTAILLETQRIILRLAFVVPNTCFSSDIRSQGIQIDPNLQFNITSSNTIYLSF